MKKDHKDDFMAYLDLWDKAVEKKIFPEMPKLDPGFPGKDYYYDNINREAFEQGLLKEAEEDRSPNPIFPDSVGKDSDHHMDAWINDKSMEELADLKKKLYDIECKLNAKDAGGAKWQDKPVEVDDKAVWKEIKSLKDKIDKISDHLGLKNEPKSSLYRTK